MKSDSYFTTRDGLRLYYEAYLPRQPKATLAFVHGLNEHCGRYQHVVERFGKRFAVFLFDLRGHGRSDGVRSHVDSFSSYVHDVGEFLELVRRGAQGLKIFMVAHSLGGQIALNYLAERPQNPLSGFVTSSANIRLGWRVNPVKKFAGMKLSRYFPKLRLPGEINVKWISSDPGVVRAYKDDPLVAKFVTVSLAREILNNQESLLALAPRIRLPAFMMHGGADRIAAPRGTEDFFAALLSRDKTMKLYPGFYHEIFNEVGKEEVFSDVEEWVWERV